MTKEQDNYYILGDIITFEKKSKRLAKDGNDIGKYPFYKSSQKLNTFTDKYDYKNENIIIGTKGNGSIHLNNKFSCSDDNFIFHSNKENIINKYIYYYLLVNFEIIENGFKGSTIKNLSKEYLNNIEIPVLSLEQQKNLIKPLDHLYIENDSIDKIINETETVSRITLSNYLFDFKNDIEEYDLDDIIIFKSKDKTKRLTKEYINHIVNSDFSILELDKDIIFNKYLEYYFKYSTFIDKDIKNISKGSTLKRVNIKELNNLEIPVPSLEQQEEIIKSLEKIDNMILLLLEKKNENTLLAKKYMNNILKNNN